MQENAILSKWILLVKRVSSERLALLSDLVSLLASPRRSEWHIKLCIFLRQERCRVLVTREDRFIYREETEEGKLGRMVRTIAKLQDGIILALYKLTVHLSSEEGGMWRRELVLLLDGKECWTSNFNQAVYLQHIFDLKGRGYTLVVYELIRHGNFRQIFGSLRDGRMDKICFPSLKVVTAQCRIFSTRFSSIKGNQVVFFPFNDNEGGMVETSIAYVNFCWSLGGDFNILKRPLEGSDSMIWDPMSGTVPNNKRVFVVLDFP